MTLFLDMVLPISQHLLGKSLEYLNVAGGGNALVYVWHLLYKPEEKVKVTRRDY